MGKVVLRTVEAGITMVLRGIGADPNDHNFRDTPKRVARMYQELFTPKETGYPVFDEAYTDEIVLRKHTFFTLCPHHLLPVEIVASVAYIPDGKVIGMSKLMRMIDDVNTLPMTQEKLTKKILDQINTLTNKSALGGAVLLVGKHGCSRVRGVKSNGDMVTMKFAGLYESEPIRQQKFLEMVKL